MPPMYEAVRSVCGGGEQGDKFVCGGEEIFERGLVSRISGQPSRRWRRATFVQKILQVG